MPRPVIEKNRGAVTGYILSLNAFIDEASAILKRDLQKIWPENIIWERQTPNINSFTQYEKCPKTPTGKLPKYEHCFYYWAELSPIQWGDARGHHKNIVFGEIFLQKGCIGKAQINHWTDINGAFLSVRLLGGSLKLWKIEISNIMSYKTTAYKAA